MSLEDLKFVHPEMLSLLGLAVPLAGLYVAAFIARRRALASFSGPGSALVSTSGGLGAARGVLALVAAVTIPVALAGPYVEERTVEVKWSGVDLVIALDVSQSMGARDVAPDRLRVARAAIRSTVDQLPGSRVALVLFGGSGIVRYPATTDPEVISRSLDSIGREYRPTAGSSLAAGVDAALGAFPQERPLPKAILVLSDGEDTTTSDVDLELLRATRVRVYALAIGTAAGAQVPAYDTTGRPLGPLLDTNGQPVISRMREDLLRRISDATSGKTWAHDGTREQPIGDLAGALRSLGAGELGGVTVKEPNDRYQLFAGIALAAMLAGWALSDRRAMPRPGRARIRAGKRSALVATLLSGVLVSCGDAAATNETANGLYAAGDYARALERYKALLREHPDVAELSVNAGNTLYRMSDFARAVPNYDAAMASPERRLRAIALYDKGNALFRLGLIAEARATFVEALKLEPHDRDTKFNIEIIDRLRASGAAPDLPGTKGQPGQTPQAGSPRPGQSEPPFGPPNAQGPQQGPSTEPRAGQQGESPESVEDALREFRLNLTPEEAMRLLDALTRQQRGIDVLLENGQRRPGQQPQY